MNTHVLDVIAIAFVLAFPITSLVEYLLHRFVLHSQRRWPMIRRHRMHHKTNHADSLWGDFRDFLPGIAPTFWLGFLHSMPAGLAFLFGSVAYVFVLATVHKLSHERPRLVFWMSRNSHALHHGETPRHNFGVVTRIWDVVFGTYSRQRSESTTATQQAWTICLFIFCSVLAPNLHIIEFGHFAY